jgi:eukaryotic-like serine/threonine-protein kinase
MSNPRYKIIKKLDAGGMAEVFKAEVETLQGFKKIVAIKRIRPHLIKDDKFVRMFMDEARLSLYLQHASIASVFDVGKTEDHFFIVMEFVEGQNLRVILEMAEGHRLPIHHVVHILKDVCEALDYAHNLRHPESGKPLGIVHRDISPPNILLSRQGEVKLVDFGLAKAVDNEKSDPGVVKGKFSYLSPEATVGATVDHRADIFAVGILLFEMITGERLFLGETDFDTVQKVREARIPPISSRSLKVPEQLETIMLRALERDPEKRYSSAADLAGDLTQFLYSQGTAVTRRDIAHLVTATEGRIVAPVSTLGTRSESFLRQLLEEEMNQLVSFGEAQNPFDETGAAPIDLNFATSPSQLSDAVLPDMDDPLLSIPVPTQDVDDSGPQQRAGSGSRPLPASVQPISFMKKKEKRGAGLGVLIGLLLLAGLGSAGFIYWWTHLR